MNRGNGFSEIEGKVGNESTFVPISGHMINFEKLKEADSPSWIQVLFDRSLKEAVLLDRAAEFFEPEPARLFKTDADSKRINEKLANLYAKLGGVPKLFITKEGVKPSDTYDDFTWYSVQEMVSLFNRARISVTKVHAKFLTCEILRGGKQLIKTRLTKKQLAAFEPIVIEEFWESAETAYIRLASMWDRVGQLLDYVFFNIRQFERDGFPSVLDRIKVNFTVLDKSVEKQQFWVDIKRYTYRDQVDGLKWLLRRRNLLVHSLHLGEQKAVGSEERDLAYYFNHLDEAARNRLGAMTPEEELKALHDHLRAFAKLLEPICDLCLWGVELIANLRKEKEGVFIC